MPPRVLAVVGARPNFVKMAPVVRALGREGADVELVHTGQHYDPVLADVFIEQLGMPRPDHVLGVGSGTHAEVTARAMLGVEALLLAGSYDAVAVPGDVNSTLGAALAAAKLRVPVVHVEAGLRSGDWSMPEEINRAVTDRISDLALCTSQDARDNLVAEGFAPGRCPVVGNTMIDTLRRLLPAALAGGTLENLGLEDRGFVLVTLHRPALVDDPAALGATFDALTAVATHWPVVVPLHPRTRARLDEDLSRRSAALRAIEPLGYLDFLALQAGARLVVTDSGGVQEETSVLGTPCLTYRSTTERPITTTLGTNTLIGVAPDALAAHCERAMAAGWPASPPTIPLWDGAAGPRAAAAITEFLADRPG